MDRAGLVGGDLIVDDVGADEFGDQLAAGAGGASAADLEAAAPEALDFAEALLHGLDGASCGAEIDIVDNGARLVDHHHVGGDRADVEAEVGGDGRAIGRRDVAADAVAELDNVG